MSIIPRVCADVTVLSCLKSITGIKIDNKYWHVSLIQFVTQKDWHLSDSGINSSNCQIALYFPTFNSLKLCLHSLGYLMLSYPFLILENLSNRILFIMNSVCRVS